MPTSRFDPTNECLATPTQPIVVDLIGYVGVVALFLVCLPPLINTLKRRSSKGLSLGGFCLHVLVSGSFLVYGYLVRSLPMLMANAYLLVYTIVLHAVRYYFQCLEHACVVKPNIKLVHPQCVYKRDVPTPPCSDLLLIQATGKDTEDPSVVKEVQSIQSIQTPRSSCAILYSESESEPSTPTPSLTGESSRQYHPTVAVDVVRIHTWL